MLELKCVRWQNLLSTGNVFTEVEFSGNGPSLVVGKNGAGKSTLLDAVVYGLFGKPYRNIKLGQLVNSITQKSLLVEVDLRTRGSSWTIRRGQKPSVFEVIKDGVLVDQAANVKDQQDWLERSVLMTDKRTFTQTVILGSAKHVPFMQLPAAQRREVVEDILDIQVFSSMNEVLKERASGLKERLTESEKVLAVAVRELEVEERHLENLQRDTVRERTELIEQAKSIAGRLEEAKTEATRLHKEAQDLTEEIADEPSVRSRLDQAKLDLGAISGRIDQTSRMMAFLKDHEDCPTCRQNIDPEFRRVEISNRTDEIRDLEDGRHEFSSQVKELQLQLDEISTVQRRISELDREFVRRRSEATSASDQLRELRTKIESIKQEEASNTGVIDELREQVASLGRDRDEVRSEAQVMQAAAGLLKDQGIKARIVKQYIPLMNRLVNKYLADLELFVDFHLDENFNEEIRSRHRDTFSYDNFSEGERMRIDLAILFAWRDIARMRNSSACDLLIFDEVLDSSMDNDGIDYFLRVVTNVVKDTNVFIISHREGAEDKFESVYSFSKRNNFSKLSVSGRRLD